MAHQVEDINLFTKKLVFTCTSQELDGFDFESKRIAFLKEKQKKTHLKGFRKGKAPLSMIQQMYSIEEFTQELFKEFVVQKIYDTIEKEDMEVLHINPVEDFDHNQESETVSFSVTLDIFPQVQVKEISGYVLTKKKSEVTDEELNQELKRIWLAPEAELRACEGEDVSFQQGLYSVINFQGILEDGSKPANMKGEEYMLTPETSFIPGFVENIVGMKKEEKKSFDLVFPADYHAKNLQNVNVTFEVELLEIKEQILPDLNDEFAKKYDFKNVDDLKENLLNDLTKAKKDMAQKQLVEDLNQKILEDNQFAIPEHMVRDKEIEHLKMVRARLKKSGLKKDVIDSYCKSNQDKLREESSIIAKQSLIFRSLVQKYKIETPKDLSPEETNAVILERLYEKMFEEVTVVEETE